MNTFNAALFSLIKGCIFHYTIMVADDAKEHRVDFGCGETFFIRLPVVIDPLVVPVGKITRSIWIEVKI